MMKRPLLIAILAAVAPAARAATLYGTAMGANCCPFTLDTVIRIDTITGDTTVLYSFPTFARPLGIAARGSELYLIDQGANRVLQIDPVTGAPMVSTDVHPASGDIFGEGDLAFRADGIGFYYDTFGLTRFDITTGTSINIGQTSDPLDGLAFDSNGVLYGYGQNTASLYIVNTTTAALTLVGPTGLGVSQTTSAGLTFTPNGTLYFDNGIHLYTLNKNTGAATLAAPGFAYAGAGASGIAFLADAPEPATLALAGLALIAIGAARRRLSDPH